MNRQEIIATALREALQPEMLDVQNESFMHNVPKGSETHFKVLVVSAAFEGMSTIDRHRKIHELLRGELANGLHALSLRALTPAQWQNERGAFESPKCLGGSKS